MTLRKGRHAPRQVLLFVKYCCTMAANDGTITFRVTRQNQTIELNTAIPANADVSLKSVHVMRVPLPPNAQDRARFCGNVAPNQYLGAVDPLASLRVNFNNAIFGTAKMIHENGASEGFSVPMNDGASTTYTPDGFDMLRAMEQETKFFQVRASYATSTGGLTSATAAAMTQQTPAPGVANWHDLVQNFVAQGGIFYEDAFTQGVVTADPADPQHVMSVAYGLVYSIEFTFAYATTRTLN